MLAAFAARISADDPMSALEVAERPDPAVPDGWTTVRIKAASLNHHDLWSLKGVGLGEDKLPMILGTDGAGIDPDGNEVIIHSVIADPAKAPRGDETLDPKRSLLSEVHDGTLAELVTVPTRNLVPKPAGLSFAEAACLPTAYLTAYRMLFTKAQVRPGQTVLVQGAGGGVATAAIALGRAAGLTVWATSRTEEKKTLALELGAHDAFDTGARLPGKVDAVIETVGEATWSHSLRALRPGGTLVVSGATTGPNPKADLNRVFFLQLNIVGSTMGTRDELVDLLGFMQATGLRPRIDQTMPLTEAAAGIGRIAAGDVVGKIVLEP